MRIFHFLATSDHPVASGVRRLRREVSNLNVPAPRPLVLPLRFTYDTLREVYWYGLQHFLCEPYFKSYCRQHGKNLRTGCYFHYITGQGDLILGDDVLFDGQVIIRFASRYSERPTLRMGNRSGCGHQTRFDIGKLVTIGDDVLIAREVNFYDSPGHPADPGARRRHEPLCSSKVKPVTVENNVWIGARATIGPGVTIGEGSIVGTGSVVIQDVAPNSVVMGNPAKKVSYLKADEVKEKLVDAAASGADAASPPPR